MRILRFLLRKEFLQIFRDKVMLRQMIAMPFVQLIVLSSAATFEVKVANLYLVDYDRTATSRGLVDRLQGSGRFRITGASASSEQANEAILHRDAGVILNIPSGLERDIVRNRAGSVQLVFNAEDGALAGVTNSYAQQIIAQYSRELGASLVPAVREAPRIETRTRGLFNPELDYQNYMIPGILVQLVTIIGTILCAMNIVREKELGTLDQLNVTPIPRSAFIAAKLIPLWVIALIELALGLILARLLFHVPIHGSVWLIFLAAAIYLIAALGIGLFVSTLVDTQQQAMFVAFFLLMIYLLMSGLFTPIRSMPVWAQNFAEGNPVKHFIFIMRGVMLKDSGLADIARPLGILTAYGAVVLSLAVRQYAKRAA